jgi:hypothetical protein
MTNNIHYYYLHTNGSLIHKNAVVVESDPQYFDSPFVKKVWKIDITDRKDAWLLVIEAGALGANKERIQELAKLWGLTDEDAHEFAKRMRLIIKIDGDEWMAAFEDFINIQESQCGFGPTALEAFIALAKQRSIT